MSPGPSFSVSPARFFIGDSTMGNAVSSVRPIAVRAMKAVIVPEAAASRTQAATVSRTQDSLDAMRLRVHQPNNIA